MIDDIRVRLNRSSVHDENNSQFVRSLRVLGRDEWMSVCESMVVRERQIDAKIQP